MELLFHPLLLDEIKRKTCVTTSFSLIGCGGRT
jgi:hypothetical protein